jgi:hypothetical protein
LRISYGIRIEVVAWRALASLTFQNGIREQRRTAQASGIRKDDDDLTVGRLQHLILSSDVHAEVDQRKMMTPAKGIDLFTNEKRIYTTDYHIHGLQRLNGGRLWKGGAHFFDADVRIDRVNEPSHHCGFSDAIYIRRRRTDHAAEVDLLNEVVIDRNNPPETLMRKLLTDMRASSAQADYGYACSGETRIGHRTDRPTLAIQTPSRGMRPQIGRRKPKTSRSIYDAEERELAGLNAFLKEDAGSGAISQNDRAARPQKETAESAQKPVSGLDIIT